MSHLSSEAHTMTTLYLDNRKLQGKGRWARRTSDGRRICANPRCLRFGVYREGASFYCLQCRRVRQMVMSARQRYPGHCITRQDVEGLFLGLVNMQCPTCNVKMIYGALGHGRLNNNIVTLNHYHNGRLGLMCFRCNKVHGRSKLGDAVFAVPSGSKFCPRCLKVLPLSSFSGKKKPSTYCRACSRVFNDEWRNRHGYVVV